jgi:hypothetical protein
LLIHHTLSPTELSAYPADCTFLEFWDHGGSWWGFGSDDSEEDGRPMSMTTLRASVASGLAAAGLEKVDMIGFDACLMSSYTVLAALHGFADFFVVSEVTEPGV